MKSLGKFISKHLVQYAGFLAILIIINVASYGFTFFHIITSNYGNVSPKDMLIKITKDATVAGISKESAALLRENHIWAMQLQADGHILWNVDLPENLYHPYTIQEVASFTKGYLDSYPVFVWDNDFGLLVLGYPKESFTKITTNYYPTAVIKKIPTFVLAMFVFDLFVVFLAYYFSKRKIMKSTVPIVDSIESLSQGKPVSVSFYGELSDVADSLNKASEVLSRQNKARANWISGISHDIRTPLSMIMGYADRLAKDSAVDDTAREQAAIVRSESIKIKELIDDLNLVSQLEYDMQPLKLERIKLAKLLRTFVADTLNVGMPDLYSLDLMIKKDAEQITLMGDSRLLIRALSNLVQNSIRHNPLGCAIQILLKKEEGNAAFQMVVMDNGVGISSEKMQEMSTKPHYMESTDEGLDLRHGLGLVLVRQITDALNGNLQIANREGGGFQAILTFENKNITTE